VNLPTDPLLAGNAPESDYPENQGMGAAMGRAIHQANTVKRNKRICTFTFGNGTTISAAVAYSDGKGEWLSYQAIFEKAKEISWVGDEERGRGGLRGFQIGEPIAA
jgi:hypothetical protein